jgi:hypothetical protein
MESGVWLGQIAGEDYRLVILSEAKDDKFIELVTSAI